MKKIISSIVLISCAASISFNAHAVRKAGKAKTYCGMSADGSFVRTKDNAKGYTVGVTISTHDSSTIRLFETLLKQGKLAEGKCDINLPKKFLKACTTEADCCAKNPDFCVNGVSFLPTE